jgi:pyrroloquinoline-quinone synthase
MSAAAPTIPPNTSEFLVELDAIIAARKKMTSPLYQLILAGNASLRLLQNFVIHRYPIKAHWTRNILGIASRVEEYDLRRELVENIYEEETGRLTNSRRHLESFIDFGTCLGLTRNQIVDSGPLLPETAAMIEHNVRVCNSHDVHFTLGVASVLLLMEGQPPIVNRQGSSMLSVMRDVYNLPPSGYEFFVHHASATEGSATSKIEDDHAETARRILARHCKSEQLKADAKAALRQATDLRHRHFDAMYRFHDPADRPFRWQEVLVA